LFDKEFGQHLAVGMRSLTGKKASVSFPASFQVLDAKLLPMFQADNFPTARGSKLSLSWRAGLCVIVLSLTSLIAGCSRLVKVSDVSIPRLLTPLVEAKTEDLLKQLQPFTNLQSLRSSPVYLRFLDAESAEKYREAVAILVLQRPDKIRLVIQAPLVKTKLAEMVSEANHFKVAIYPSGYQRFLLGTNDADYSMWRAKLGENERRSALVSARPFHFTEALLLRPLNQTDARFAYALEETLVNEPDTKQGAKKGARVLRSFYVISEVEVIAGQPSFVRRRFWFDRTNQLRFSRQQIFDNRGELATDVQYAEYRKLNPDNQDLWPSVITVDRPHDGYSARLTFTEERFELNPELPPSAFTLENVDGLPETNLDKDRPAMP
jgi:hypothetical protein